MLESEESRMGIEEEGATSSDSDGSSSKGTDSEDSTASKRSNTHSQPSTDVLKDARRLFP